jgi:biotin-(acetyl-CoA carboxylase) ligase
LSETTTALPPLPSVFYSVPTPAGVPALDHAAALAAGQGVGLLAWAPGDHWAEAALVLAPEDAGEARLAVLAGCNALADALALSAPAELPLGFAWPGGLLLNGGRCGVVQARPGPDGLLLLGFRLRLAFASGHEVGLLPGETALREEGADPTSAAELTAAWALHLMAGLDAWQARGWQRMAETYLARLLDPAAAPGLKRGIDPATGALLLDRDGVREARPC